MHFRNFILICAFLGVAVFLPNNVFAEKNGATGNLEPLNSAVQTLVSEKVEDPIASEKVVPDTPENVHKSQDGVVQKPVTNPSTQQNGPIKPVPKSPNEENRVIEKIVPSLQKNIKAGESAEPSAKEKDTGQIGPTENVKDTGQIGPTENVKDTGQIGPTENVKDTETEPAQPNAVKNKLPEVTKSVSSNQTDSKVEINRHSADLNAKSKNFTKNTVSSVSIKTSSSLALTQKPHVDKENKTPSDNRKIPGVIGIMNNPPQRTQSSGGQSDDQLSPGAGTISFIANWSDWDKCFALNFIQDYISRQAKYCDQWINGPPSPPPKTAPFFTSTVDFSHR